MPKPLKHKQKAFKRSLRAGVERLNGVDVLPAPSWTPASGMPSRFEGYMMRGRWMTSEHYGRLRNAGYVLRNARVPPMHNPAALRVALYEVSRLLSQGEELADVFEAFAEVIIHP